MAVNWTKEQEEVIRTRKRNILVSAAAGSGKTAVLVARILRRICDEEDPVDIDELLIVTFTNAAAGEMRERICRALEEERMKRPEDEHIARQSALISAALITTIDGFCSYVIRNYGHLIGVPPVFRVAEKGETELLKQDALKEILEEAYASKEEAFQASLRSFVETFAAGKSERVMEEAILSLAGAADSCPDPEAWLALRAEEAELEKRGEVFHAPWFGVFWQEVQKSVRFGLHLAKSNLDLTLLPEGPSAYEPSARGDFELFEALSEACLEPDKNYDRIRKLLAEFKRVTLSTKKPAPGENPVLRTQMKARRQELDKIRKSLLADFFPVDAQTAVSFCALSAGPLGTLIFLAQRFRKRYGEKKAERGIVDYSDLEHFALRILKNGSGRSYAAKELSHRFREVMIDEYQDSNYLQEEILLSVSRLEEGEQNYFCVGDVKQSIYSFRQARPELFMDKFERFRRDEREGVRIDLHRNFRSRQGVIESVNGLFEQMMRQEIGGVEYDEEAALIPGAQYPACQGMESELLVLLKEEAEEEDIDPGKLSSSDARDMEARMVGARIRELMEGTQIYDRTEDRMRNVRYRDIVILLRTMEGWADVFVRVLESMRIPAYATSTSGYFSAMEVTALLNYLSVLDNPEQDIPFTAVLTSAFVSLNAQQLSLIRTADLGFSLSGSGKREDVSMYEAARAYAACDGGREIDRTLQAALQDFFALYDSFRAQVPDTPLHELIRRILTKTGFLDYASALPGGTQRMVNLQMLMDKAAEYEQTSYAGLFNFIRYIENLKTYSQDFGELAAISEQEDVVRIYSIHKSKGLEYPIVFVSGLSKAINLQDLNREPLIHPELGAASNYLDYVRRTKAPTIHRQAIRRRLLSERLGEELRVLYVALTRAQQKLILTGTYSKAEKLDELFLLIPASDRALPLSYLEKSRNWFDWIYPAVKRMNERAGRIGLPDVMAVRSFTLSELMSLELLSSIRREDVLEQLSSLDGNVIYDAKMRRAIEERFSYRYPYPDTQLPVEVSVSELKEAAIRGMRSPLTKAEEDAPHLAEELFPEELVSPLIPDFYRKMNPDLEETSSPAGGAVRGTAFHHIMEVLDLKAFAGLEEGEIRELLSRQLESLLASGRVDREEASLVDPQAIVLFLTSPLGQRMALADQRGDLSREQPFVLGVDAASLKEEWPLGETVFVQGIIDAFFYEEIEGETGIVLMDYKTDRVRKAGELVLRYQVQLDAYASALRRVTGMQVFEKKIWSFALGTEVSC